MSAPIEQLLSRLDGVQRVRPNGWKSRCPSHNGEGKSLVITHSDDGRILIHCFAHECEPGDILSAIGMSVADLFPDRLPERVYPRMKHAISAMDVVRVLKHELFVVQLLANELGAGRQLDEIDRERAVVAAGRIRKALDICSA